MALHAPHEPPPKVAASEETDAKAALVATPGAVGAYDKVPFQSASAVFTFDTSSATITVHSFQASAFSAAQPPPLHSCTSLTLRLSGCPGQSWGH